MKITRDPRPVSQQIFSGLKIAAVVLLVGAALFIVWLNLPRYRIEAFFWHLRHGNSIDVGRYRIPVPWQWYVQDPDNLVMLINLNTGDSIIVDVHPAHEHFSLSSWADRMIRAQARLGGDWKTTGRRDFQISGESVLCLEQEVDRKFVHSYPIQCRSDGAVGISFQPNFGKTRDAEFYSLLQQVHKL